MDPNIIHRSRPIAPADRINLLKAITVWRYRRGVCELNREPPKTDRVLAEAPVHLDRLDPLAIDDISDVQKKQATGERLLKTHGTSSADAMGLSAMAQCA